MESEDPIHEIKKRKMNSETSTSQIGCTEKAKKRKSKVPKKKKLAQATDMHVAEEGKRIFIKEESTSNQLDVYTSYQRTFDQTMTQGMSLNQTMNQDIALGQVMRQGMTLDQFVTGQMPFDQTVKEEMTFDQTMNQETTFDQTVKQEMTFDQTVKEEMTFDQTVKEEMAFDQTVKQEVPTDLEEAAGADGFLEVMIREDLEESNDNIALDYEENSSPEKVYNIERKKRSPQEHFECQFCYIAFNSEYDFRVHNIEHIGKVSVQCEVCHYEVKNRQEWHYHKSRKHKKFECGLCGKVVSKIKAHMQYMHTNQEDCHEKCSICSKSFSTKYLLNMHITNVHALDQNLKCEHCGLKFKSERNLKEHVNHFHLKINLLECNECGKTFPMKQKSRFDDHMNMHNGIKPYNCPVCGQSFHARYLLSKHKKFCYQRVEYKCKGCDKKIMKDYFREHVMSKHCGDVQFHFCIECKIPFKATQNYSKHYKKYHPYMTCDTKISDENIAILDAMCEKLKSSPDAQAAEEVNTIPIKQEINSDEIEAELDTLSCDKPESFSDTPIGDDAMAINNIKEEIESEQIEEEV